MKKITLILSGILLASVLVKGQDKADTAWKVSSDISLMLAQSSFTNWAAGGDNSITLNGFFNFYAGYIKGKSKWENMLGLAYGQSKIGEQEFRKNEDKIDFLSNYGFKAAEKWYYSVNFNFKTQFADGYNYSDVDTVPDEKISAFMAPGFISLGVGMEYRPYEFMSFYLSPATARWIIVNDTALANAGAFGVESAYYDDHGTFVPGEKVKNELGAYFRFLFVKDIWKNVNLNTKLELFSNYLKNPQNIDINWDTMIGFKVNDWLAASFGIQMLYDDETPITDKDGNTGPRTQIKQLFSFGLTYKISNDK